MISVDNVVVTGYGMKAPGAMSKEDFYRVLKKGICTHSVLEGRGKDQTNIIAGVIEDDFEIIRERNYKRYPRSTRMALAAAADAVEMSNLLCDPHRVAIIIGTSAGAILEIEHYSSVALDLKKYPLHGVSLVDSHTLSAAVAQHIGTRGPAYTITTGCTASLDAVLLGKLMLESGQVDACIVGGTDAPLGQWSINGFVKTRAIMSDVSIHQTGVPFSTHHQGFVLSEGAGIMVLEREDTALKSGKTIYGKIQNVVSRNEGRPLLKSDETGEEMLSVYKDTLGDTIPCYTNSQALGLKTNDRIEGYIHKHMFANDVPLTSIKGMVGHSFAAMGAIQMISALLSIEYGFIPPTIKTGKKGFEDLPIVCQTIYQPVRTVSVTAHGNSGNNACAIVTK